MIRLLVLVFSFFLAGGSAFAQSGAAGGGGSSNSSFRFEGTLGGGNIAIGKSASQFGLAPSFYFKPLNTDILQVGGEVEYQSISYRGGSANIMTILAGVTGNVGSLNTAVFCMMGVAIKRGSGGTGEDSTTEDPSGLGYHFVCGKRIPLGGSWSLKPSLGVVATGTSAMVFRPFAISYLF